MIDLLFLVLVIFFSLSNGHRAMLKGYNRWVWSLFTLIGFIIGEIIGCFIVIFYLCRDVIDVKRFSTDATYNDTAVQILKDEFTQNPIRLVTIYMFGVGGYLAVRFIADRLPIKNSNAGPGMHGNANT